MRLWPSQRSKNNATSLQRSVTHDVLRVYAGVACRAGVSGGTQCGPMRFLLSQHERPAGVQAIIRHTVHSSGRGQIPPDLVVKSQRIDITDVNLWLI